VTRRADEEVIGGVEAGRADGRRHGVEDVGEAVGGVAVP